jgi:segregation and condensation protein B
LTRPRRVAILPCVTDLDLVRAEERDGEEGTSTSPPETGDASGASEAGDSGSLDGAGEPAGAGADELAGGEPGAKAADGEAAETSPRASEPGPGDALDDETLVQHAAALLFASPEQLTLDRLVQLLERPAKARVRAALAELAQRFEAARLPLTLTEIAGGWRILSRPELGEVIHRLAKVRGPEKVTPAMLETLAIVAYRQPVTNAEVEAIRGVQSGAMLRTLVDRSLVRVTGRADQPGSPLQYGTTRDFLDRFGLASIKDLPRDGELAKD